MPGRHPPEPAQTRVWVTEEAVGIVRAATATGLPVALSFTVETDGRLPTGQPPAEAIDRG